MQMEFVNIVYVYNLIVRYGIFLWIGYLFHCIVSNLCRGRIFFAVSMFLSTIL